MTSHVEVHTGHHGQRAVQDEAHRPAHPRARWRRYWPLLRRVLTLTFLVAVIGLLASMASDIDWAQVARSLRSYEPRRLALAALLALVSFSFYASYDLLGRAYTGHKLASRLVFTIATISFAFNLNLGALVGGFGFRYRLYARAGLRARTTTRILTFSIMTNWLGYILVAGVVFTAWPPRLPADWAVGRTALQAMGVALLGAVATYLALCAWLPRRFFAIRSVIIEIPKPRVALLQIALAASHWLATGTALSLLLPGVSYPTIVGVYLFSAVAASIVHVPAGLGVLEAVFLTLLGASVGRAEVIAALLAFRAAYYLLPLALATPAYVLFEARVKTPPASAHH